MRYIILLLSVLLFACEPPLSEDDMAKKYPSVNYPPAVPVVATITPRNGGWSGDNQLGYMAKYGPDKRQRQTILKLDEWGPPEMWTISLFVDQKLELFNGFNVKALINFGAGGSTQTIELDWLNGAQISLPMNAVNVVATFENVSVTTEGQGLSVGVQLSRGSRGGTIPPTRTLIEQFARTTGTITDLIEIPNFARRICVAPTDMTAAERAVFYSITTTLNLYAGNSGVGSIPVMIAGDRTEAGLLCAPVIKGARFFAVQNDGAQTIRFSAYAELEG